MIIFLLPIRLKRFGLHLIYYFNRTKNLPQYHIIKSFGDWFFSIPFYFIDIIGLNEIYEILNELVNWKIRSLSSHEKLMITDVFDVQLPLDHYRIHADNMFAKWLKIAYVSFRQINFSGMIRNDIFIHEVVHLIQYQVFGSVYIYHALKAQNSKEGYDYGSLVALKDGIQKGKLFHEYNFEQQAEIIQDYYQQRFLSGLSDPDDAYQNYLYQLRDMV